MRGKLHFPHTPISDFADGVMSSRGASFCGRGGPAGLTCRHHPKKLPPFGHGPRVPPAAGFGYFSGTPLSGIPCGASRRTRACEKGTHRPTASGYGGGPSLRCVRLRRFCSLLLISFEMSSFLTSAPRRLPRYCAGLQRFMAAAVGCNVLWLLPPIATLGPLRPLRPFCPLRPL